MGGAATAVLAKVAATRKRRIKLVPIRWVSFLGSCPVPHRSWLQCRAGWITVLNQTHLENRRSDLPLPRPNVA
jgi:hypothetical protein